MRSLARRHFSIAVTRELGGRVWSSLQLITGAVIFVYIPALPGLYIYIIASAVLIKTSFSDFSVNCAYFRTSYLDLGLL